MVTPVLSELQDWLESPLNNFEDYTLDADNTNDGWDTNDEAETNDGKVEIELDESIIPLHIENIKLAHNSSLLAVDSVTVTHGNNLLELDDKAHQDRTDDNLAEVIYKKYYHRRCSTTIKV